MRCSKKLKQNFIVENVSGGGTIIATGRVAQAAPDGYTLLLHNLQISANVTLYKNLPFDTEKDLDRGHIHQQATRWCWSGARLPANNLNELIALMKTAASEARAIPGYGATGHLATTLLAQEAKVQIDYIPYRGAAPAMQDILGDHVDLFFATPQSVVPQVTAGQDEGLWHHSEGQVTETPDCRKLRRCAWAEIRNRLLAGMFAPGGTPEA